METHTVAFFVALFIACTAVGQTPSKVNRAVPEVGPAKTSLEFSEMPTREELSRARVFEEPLVPIGPEPNAAENSALAAALLGYARRNGPDDFDSLSAFLEQHPKSSWCPALLLDLGLEYYNTAHYSLALDAWQKAWTAGKDARNAKGKAIADRAVGELAFMYARLGRMRELEALLKSVEGRGFGGPAAQKIVGAREGLWGMQNRPEVSFRCGPLALRCIKLTFNSQNALEPEILNSASTQNGFSLTQVAELSKKVGLNYQMGFREKGGEVAVPSVVHWKVGHYAALVRKEGNLYLLQDPTFGNQTWATKEALEAETSGYFLIPPGPLPQGWRSVELKEGGTVWGKGRTFGNDDRCITKRDRKTCSAEAMGMTVPAMHLMTVNLNLNDQPVGYTPPVGPPVRLMMRYNHRDSFQPANFTYSNFGPKWTCDWISYITDHPSNVLADVNLYSPGGGERTFTGFDPNSQTFAPQQYDQTILRRTGDDGYELLSGDGSKLVFSQSDGAIGTSRKVFLTRMVDPAGNAVTLTYDNDLRITALTDAIGQVTTLSYELSDDIYKVTKVTDPFGRSAVFDYEQVDTDWKFVVFNECPTPSVEATAVREWWLASITDVIGLTSRFNYFVKRNALSACAVCPADAASVTCVTKDISLDFIASLITPYGTNTFQVQDLGNTRILEAAYPDGSLERVEYNQTNNIPPEPDASVPLGINHVNANLEFRNTYYWSRTANALAYLDRSKARLYHWLHTEDLSTTSGCLESLNEPLENRVWYDYAGQSSTIAIGPTTRPAHIGRVLDDGSTQLYTRTYNPFGKVTRFIDPVGRTLSYIYDTNNVDLLEIRQTRGGNNELLLKASYNSQHRPLTVVDAAGQTNTFTYNARGQLLTATNPRNETAKYTYDPNGFLLGVDGPLQGTNDTAFITYDAFGRVRTITDISGYTQTLDYDTMDRPIRVTNPDSTFTQATYDRLDLAAIQDRAGRQSFMKYDSMRQIAKFTDTLGRTTHFEWCACGDLKSLIDPMGRMTTWTRDVQGRILGKQYGDGSQIKYVYEEKSSRLRQIIDEKQQVEFFTYNRDNTLKSIAFGNCATPTPSVSYTYDPDYARLTSMADGTGTTLYSYNPIAATPALGAGALAKVDGPFDDDTITYTYDALGRRTQSFINGLGMGTAYDAAGRITNDTNILGSFSFSYDGSSRRVLTETFPNGQTMTRAYGDNSHDRSLQRISYTQGSLPLSEFVYARDIARGQITTWSQQAGSQPPTVFSLGYDAGNQLLSAATTSDGALVNSFAYTYDPAGNRLTEQIGALAAYNSTYNSLNQINTTTAPATARTNEWDALNRLTAVNAGNERTEFTYDGLGRFVAVRKLVNGSEISFRRFVWCMGRICEERDKTGSVVMKRFFAGGFELVTGPDAGLYYYTRDHLGSIREVTDASGTVRARYSYDPYGRRSKLSGDINADFGFAGMFWCSEASLALTHFRAYDPDLGRWLSRDPLQDAELKTGRNLYAYVRNNPVNLTDLSGKAPWLGVSPENPKAAPAGSDPVGKLVSEGGQASQEVLETTTTSEEDSPALQDLRQTAADALANAEQNKQCFLSADVALFSASEIAAAVVISFAVGVTAGVVVADYGLGANKMATNVGLKVEEKTGSRFLGGYATLQFASYPSVWVVSALFDW